MAHPTPDESDVLAKLEEMPAFLDAAFGALSSSEAAVPGPNGTFSPLEQCWHLADLEREGYGARIRRLLSEHDPFLPDFDGERVARERRYRTLSLAEGLHAFRAARADTVSVLRSIRGDEWEWVGWLEGVGFVVFRDFFVMMATHDAAYRSEIEVWMRVSTFEVAFVRVVVVGVVRNTHGECGFLMDGVGRST
jgi:hypothetical protein